MIITKNGIAIRLNVADLRLMGRATQGVRLINIQDDDAIAAVTQVEREDDEASETTPNNLNSSTDINNTPSDHES